MKIVRALAFVLMVAACSSVFAEIPGAKDPNAYTEHTYRREQVDFFKRAMSGAYQTAGRKNAKWDAPAKAFLDDMAAYFASEGADADGGRYRIEGCKSAQQLLVDVEALFKLGCDDSLVLSCKAMLLQDSGRSPESLAIYQNAFFNILQTNYPAFILANVARRYHVSIAPDHPDKETVWNAFLANAPKACQRDALQGADRRIVLEMILDKTQGMADLDLQKDFYEQLKNDPASDPWITKMAGGRYHLRAAWMEVQDQPYTIGGNPPNHPMAAKMKLAREHLVAAWTIEPKFPESSVEMINISPVVAEFVPEEDAIGQRGWFDRACEAQFDYLPAYETMMRSMFDVERKYALGLEALETARFDTRVPWMLKLALDEARSGSGKEAFDQFEQLGAYPNIQRLFEGELSNPNLRLGGDFLRAHYGAISWAMGHCKEAIRILVLVQNDPHEEVFGQYGLFYPDILDLVPVSKTRHFDAVLAAVGLLEQEKADSALSAFIELQPQILEAEPAQYVLSRIMMLRALKRFEEGEWVSIQPRDPETAWKKFDGRWAVLGEPLRLSVISDPGVCAAVHIADFGPRYEMSVKFKLVIDGQVSYSIGGLVVEFQSLENHYQVVAALPERQLFVRDAQNRGYAQPAPVAVDNDMLVRVYDGMIWVTLNGAEVFKGHRIGGGPVSMRRVGVAGALHSPSQSVLFSELKIRKLDAPPAE